MVCSTGILDQHPQKPRLREKCLELSKFSFLLPVRLFRRNKYWRAALVSTALTLLVCTRGMCGHHFGKYLGSTFRGGYGFEIVSTNRNTWNNLTCVRPILDIDDPVMMSFFKKITPVSCGRYHADFVYVENGTLFFSNIHTPKTKCNMSSLIRGPGDNEVSFGPEVTVVDDGTPLTSDFFKIECEENGDVIYESVQPGVHLNKTLKNRTRSTKPPSDGLNLSVLMLGLDSMSRMSWLRRLPLMRRYFVDELGAIELEGYNIVGDGTPAALLPMLTGRHEHELPEARKNKPDAQSMDAFPWIWKDFEKHGYITSWADSATQFATFNYRLMGFEHPPTDFYLRPFYLAAEKSYAAYHRRCYGARRLDQVWFDFVKDIFKMYKHEPKFLLHFFDTFSHDNNNIITMCDEEILQMLEFLELGGYLENTVVVMFADHGARFSTVRGTTSGKLEERLPYFALRFPRWFHNKHPDLINNVKTNAKRLTTMFDIHETLKDILHFSGSGVGDLKKRGISLFKEIPQERGCAHADIAPHWCACMTWTKRPTNDANVELAAEAAIDAINELTQQYRKYCELLSIMNITSALQSELSQSVLRFSKTTGDRGLEPILDDMTKQDKILFQLTFVTAPGGGAYEVTVEQDLKREKLRISQKDISRINMYRNDWKCIEHKTSELRPYCYCKQKH